MKEGDNSFGVAGVSLSLVSLFLFWVPLSSAGLGIVSFVFGLLQRRREKNSWATWAIALGIAAIIINVVMTLYYISAVFAFQELIAQQQAGGVYG